MTEPTTALPVGYEPPLEPLKIYVCPGCNEVIDIPLGARTVACRFTREEHPWVTIYAYTIRHYALRAEAAVARLSEETTA